jgi:glycosyltransferase involved in cell wall biosynthesis
MSLPLVSILIISHNQADFIQESVESALNQTYPNTEVLIVEDGSTDHTLQVIQSMQDQGITCKTILLNKSIGYCKAFNQGFERSKGAFIIDLSADDILLPERITYGVEALQTNDAGVNFCDAYYIDEHSSIQGTHYRRNARGVITEPVKYGDVFSEVLRRYYICAPTMFIDRKVLNHLGGYDEDLYYEDFDFWVRSSRSYQYHFTDKVLVKKRVLKSSMSKTQYLPNSKMLPTTLRVCQKAYNLCNNPQEYQALATRLRYEIRQALISSNHQVAVGLNDILFAIGSYRVEATIWNWLIARNWDLSFLTRFAGIAR